MRVAFVTSSDLKCGIAEYGRNLMKHLPEVQWKVVGHRSIVADLNGPERYDIVHVNYEPGLFPPNVLGYVLQFGAKRLLTLHTSQSGDNRSGITEAFHKTIVHEQCVNLTMPGTRFVHIAMGLPVQAEGAQAQLPPVDVGSVGFPFPWKGFPQVAAAAYQLKLSCGLIMPDSPHIDYRLAENACRAACPEKLVTVSKWVSEPDVLASLKNCRVNVFAYQGANVGISGAVRMGMASGQPIVLTRCRQFCDLFAYEDEIEFVNSPHPNDIAQGIQRVLANGKRPRRVLQDMSWKNSADKYLEVYRSLVA